MQEALHLRVQRLHSLHFSASITGLKSEKREKNPSTVPTGQMVLQYVLPLRHARITTAMSVTAAIMKVGMLLIHTSVS